MKYYKFELSDRAKFSLYELLQQTDFSAAELDCITDLRPGENTQLDGENITVYRVE
jgi:hypothetical protein